MIAKSTMLTWKSIEQMRIVHCHAANRLNNFPRLIDNGNDTSIYSTFDGKPVSINSILVKYTFNDNKNWCSKVDAEDYFKIDDDFVQQFTGCYDGDFDFNSCQ